MSSSPQGYRRLFFFLTLGLAFSSLLGAREVEIRGRLLGHDGRPLAGADVRLHHWLSETEIGRRAAEGEFQPEAVAAVSSADDGSFRLLAPGPDRWELAVRDDEHVPVVRWIVPSLGPVDLGEVDLPRRHPQRIRLVDEDGRPVAGFRLAAMGLSSSWNREGWGLETRRAETGDDGRAAFPRLAGESLLVGGVGGDRFVFERLEPSADPVRVVLRDTLREARATDFDGRPVEGAVGLLPMPTLTFGPSGKDGVFKIPFVPVKRIVTEPGMDDGPLPLLFFDEDRAHYGRVAPIETEDGLVVPLPGTRRVRGQVLDEATEEGVAGAWVSTDADSAATGRGGAFTVRLSPGPRAWLIVKAAGYAEEVVQAQALELAAEQELRIRLRKVMGLSGRVVDADGVGVARASVRIRVDPRWDPANSMRSLHHVDEEVVADEDGGFRLTGLPDSIPFLLRASAPGYSPRVVRVSPIERGTPPEPIEIALAPGGTVSGTVWDAGGQPAAGARVLLYSAFRRSVFYEQPESHEERVLQAVSDVEGRFELADLMRGVYELRVEAPGHAPLQVPGVEIGDDPAVDLGRLHLEAGAVLEGQVLGTEGRPIAGAHVRLTASGTKQPPEVSTPTVHTEADGSFRFPDLSRSVPVTLFVKAVGYSDASLPGVSVERDEPLTVTLERASAVAGRVVDDAGRPAEAQVELTRISRSSRSSTSTTTGPTGRFKFPNLEGGRVSLSATSADGAADPLELELEPGESRDLEIVLRPAAKILGTLLGPGGEPVADARVLLERSRPGEVPREPHADRARLSIAASDVEGRFALTGLRAGTYRLNVEHPDYGSLARTLELTGGTIRELSLRFEDRGGLPVQGRVTNEAGEGVPATVRLFAGDRGSGVDFETTLDGSFDLRAPSPGVYAVVADALELATGRSEPFEVGAGGVRGLVLELDRGATIAGGVQGLEARDYARIRLRAFHRETNVWRHGVVNSEGRYRIQYLAPGDWSVIASLEGSGRAVNGRATLGPAGDVVQLDLEFGEASRIIGLVLLDGRPLSAGFVRAFCAGKASAIYEIGSDGRFEIAEVPHGDCTLQATGADRALAGVLDVEVPAASEVILELESGTLSGSVLGIDGRRPVPGARVFVQPERRSFRFYGSAASASASSASETARTDAAGRFSFPAITPGSWVLRVDIDGYESHERKVQATGLVDEVEILLRPTMPVVLVVRSADGSVPSQVWVIVPDGRGGAAWSRQYRPDGEGRVVLRRLPPDVRRLRVTGENGEAAEIDVGVRGEPVPVVLAR